MFKIDRASIALSNHCNLRCTYCFVERNKIERLNKEQIEIFIKWFIKQPSDNFYKKLHLFGGEPFLEFDLLKDAISFFKKQNTKKESIIDTINTNGTILSKEILDFIKEEKLMIAFSLDGDRMSNFARKFKNGKDCFDVVWNNMKKFREFIGYPPSIKMTILPSNVKNLYSNIRFLVENGFYKIEPNHCFVTTKWSRRDLNEYINEFRKILHLYLHCTLLKKPISIWPITEAWGKSNIDDFKEGHFHCGCGRQPFLSFDGNLYGCELGFSDKKYFKEKLLIGKVTNKKVIIDVLRLNQVGENNVLKQYDFKNRDHCVQYLFGEMFCYTHSYNGPTIKNTYLKMVEMILEYSNRFHERALRKL